MARRLTLAHQIAFLARLGLPGATKTQRKRSWATFQAASTWHRYDAHARAAGALKPDGDPGPLTLVHVAACKRHGHRIAPHFKLSEFRCRALGHRHTSIAWRLVVALESLREDIGPITIVTGYRCRTYNTRVGGQPDSAHTEWPANAVDLRPHVRPALVKGHGFRGIGVRDVPGDGTTTRVVIHVDQQAKNPLDCVFVDG